MKRLLIFLAFVYFGILASCNLFSPASEKLPYRLDGIVGADAVMLRDSSSSSRTVNQNGYSMSAVDSSGNIRSVELVDENDKIMELSIDKFIPVGNYSIVTLHGSNFGSGTNLAIRSQIMLVDNMTGKLYSLTPPYTQQAIDFVDGISDDPSCRIYGTMRLGIDPIVSGYINEYVSDLIFQDRNGLIFYSINAQFIVDSKTPSKWSTGGLASSTWISTTELVCLDPVSKTQKSLFLSATKPDGLIPAIGLVAYFVNRDGTVFYTVSVNGAQGSISYPPVNQYSYQLASAGTNQALSFTPDIYNSTYFLSKDGGIFYHWSPGFFYDLSNAYTSIKEFTQDGAGLNVYSLKGYPVLKKDIITNTSRYVLLSDSNLDIRGLILKRYFDITNDVFVLNDDDISIVYNGHCVTNLNSVNLISNQVDANQSSVFLNGTLDDNTNSILRIDLRTKAISKVNGLDEYIILGQTQSKDRIVLTVFKVSSMACGTLDILEDGTISAFKPDDSMSQESSPVQLIMLN